eukprot:jgi/Botrbrau1/12782/Bobra.117_1s0001.1
MPAESLFAIQPLSFPRSSTSLAQGISLRHLKNALSPHRLLCSLTCTRTLRVPTVVERGCPLILQSCGRISAYQSVSQNTAIHSVFKTNQLIAGRVPSCYTKLASAVSSVHASQRNQRNPRRLSAKTGAMAAQNGATTSLSEGVPGFADREVSSFSVGILGDLHLEPGQMHLFEEAREHFISHLVNTGIPGPRIVQLGDLGGYSNRPGLPICTSRSGDGFHCFVRFLTFQSISALRVANHAQWLHS